MTNAMSHLLAFLARVEEARIAYRLEHNRDEAIMVILAIPGERWEVEFFENGTVEIEIFVSDGAIRPIETLERLFASDGEARD